MAGADSEVREEYFLNEGTDVEAEQDEDLEGGARPWNPTDIRVSTKQFSLRNIMDLIDEEDLDLAPDFQRHQVWKGRQKSRLIESILLQIPLPAFYFAEEANGLMRVVDGLQRLSTVHGFARKNLFALSDLEYLTDGAEGKSFNELPPAMRRRINNAQITVHVIDPTTPSAVKYDIFKRINTGGTPLNSQEIRHCMTGMRSRAFLKRCTDAPEFDNATGGRFKEHSRMGDREVVLRFCAFRILGLDKYAESRGMDDFLDIASAGIDDPKEVSDQRLDKIYEEFRSAMCKASELFGEHAFRKWISGSEKRNPINRALFESWSNVLCDHTLENLLSRKEHIVTAARRLMTDNREYIDAITSSTGDPRKVRLRFQLAGEAARAES